MGEQELESSLMADYRRLSDAIDDHFTPLRIANIKELRDLIKHFTITSAAIIGLALPLFGRSTIVRDDTTMIFGLLFLLLVVVMGVSNLNRTLQRENRELTIQHRKINEQRENLRTSYLRFIGSKKQESDVQSFVERNGRVLSEVAEVLDQKESPDYTHDLILIAFLLGLLLLILSLTNYIGWISRWMVFR